MKNIWSWLKDSHRLQHLGLGAVYGLLADDWYCALYGSVGVAGALELKDKLWGGKPDLIDFCITVLGVAVGYSIRMLTLKLL